MDKNVWISHKIAKLVEEGKPQQQAIAIAYSMWEQGDKKQEGGDINNPQTEDYFKKLQTVLRSYSPAFKPIPMAQQGLQYNRTFTPPNTNLDTQIPTSFPTVTDPMNSYASQTAQRLDTANPMAQMPSSLMGQFQPNAAITSEAGFKEQYSAENVNKNAVKGVVGTTGTGTSSENNNDWIKYNILNPYGQGMDLGTSLAYTGQQFGKGNTGMGIAGAGLSVLKGARNFLSGYGAGKGERNVEQEIRDKLYNSPEVQERGQEGGYMQGGGKTKAYLESGQFPEDEYYTEEQTDNQLAPVASVPTQNVPNEEASLVVASEQEKSFKGDKNSARDTWTHKTGLPWSEAKRLGYTDGTAKDNTKLLSELNSSGFKKENIRSKPFTAPIQTAKIEAAQVAKIAKVQNFFDSAAYKALPKNKKVQAQAKAIEEAGGLDMIRKVGEALANPLQAFGEYAKYGELPASGFSKNKTNAYDDVLGIINPLNWANHAANAVDYTEQGAYLDAAKEAAGALPAAGKLLKTVKYVPYLEGLPAANTTTRAAGYLREGAARLQPAAQKVFPIYNGARRGAEYVSGSYRPYEEGGFVQGQEYDLTEEEVQDLVSKGYKIKYKQ